MTMENYFKVELRSLVMWAHYTGYHRGYCVEYSTSTLSDEQRRHLYPVRYCQTRFDVTENLGRYIDSNSVKPSDAHIPIMAAAHKSPDWSYEQEWRLIQLEGNERMGAEATMPTPAALYLGVRMLVDRREQILAIARAKGISCYEMRLGHSTFTLEPRSISDGETMPMVPGHSFPRAP